LSLGFGGVQAAIRRTEAYIVADLHSGKVLRHKNSNKPCYPASLTKKMTLYLLFEALKKGKISLHTRFRVSPLAARQMKMNLQLKPGSYLTVKEIIEALIVKSANDAAVVAAEGISGTVFEFVKLMNQKAQKLGMKKTCFQNPSGIPHPRQVTTARDMALLAKALFQNFPEFAPLFRLRSFEFRKQKYYTHNHLLNEFHGTEGIKTGYIRDSGYNISLLVTRYDEQHRAHSILCIVLGGQTPQQRDQRAVSLVETACLKKNAIFYKARDRFSGFTKLRLRLCFPSPLFLRAPLLSQGSMRLLLNKYTKQREEDEKFFMHYKVSRPY
jgi:D-alanyl-D-alanine carboxypeptidase